MKKLIGVVCAVFLILFLNGPAFANELPIEEIADQGMQAMPEGETAAGEDTPLSESETPAAMEDAEIANAGESSLSVWTAASSQASIQPTGQPSHIDTVKVDLSVDSDGQTFMPLKDASE